MPMHCPICRKGHWWKRTGAPAVDSTRPNLGRQHRIAAGSTRPRAHNGLVQLSQDSRQSFPSIFRISVAGSFVVALSRSFRTVRSESPHNCAISVTRRPRRRSRFIRSTTSGVTFKSPPRRRLGIPSGTAEFGLPEALNHNDTAFFSNGILSLFRQLREYFCSTASSLEVPSHGRPRPGEEPTVSCRRLIQHRPRCYRTY
jgi:hypothetical protein